MNPATRLSEAFRRLGSIVGIRLVRDDEVVREVRHGGSVSDLNARTTTFAEEIEHKVTVQAKTIT